LFGEKNLRPDMEKHEEIGVVEVELWDQFQHYTYEFNFCEIKISGHFAFYHFLCGVCEDSLAFVGMTLSEMLTFVI